MKVFNLAVIGLFTSRFKCFQSTAFTKGHLSLSLAFRRVNITTDAELRPESVKKTKKVTQRVESCVFNNPLLEFFHGCRIFQENIVTHNTIDYFPAPYTEQVKTTRQQTNDTTGVESSRNQNYVFDEFKYRG